MDRLFANNQNTQGVYGNLREDFNTAKNAISGFFGSEAPSVMEGQAATDLYNNSELAGLFSNLLPGKAALGAGAGILRGYKTLPRSLLESIGKGATARELFDDHNAVKVGDKWFQFLKDDLRVPPQGFQGTSNVKNLTNGLSGSVGNIPVSFQKMPDNRWGVSEIDKRTGTGNLTINSRLSPTSQRETLGHEIQHPYDVVYNGHTGGTTKDATPAEKVQYLQEMLQDKRNNVGLTYDPFDHYQHNAGEMRARLNALLNNDPEHYQGLESIFHKGKYYPEMVWE